MQLIVRKADPALVSNFIDFSNSEYSSGSAIDPDYVKWRHLESPCGPSVSVELHKADEQIGRIWVHSNCWNFDKHELRVASPIDLLIHPNFRNTMNFISLLNSGMKTALSESDLVLHTSNPTTDGLYRNLLKLSPIAELDGALFPLRPINLVKAKLGISIPRLSHTLNWTYKKFVGFFAAFVSDQIKLIDTPSIAIQDQIINSFHMNEPFASRRNLADRNWRYSEECIFHYQTQWIGKANSPVGYLVWSDREVDGIKGRFIIDVVLGEDLSRSMFLSMWGEIIKSSLNADLDSIFFFFNSKCSALRRIAGFPLLRVKRSRLPQQIPIFARLNDNTQHEGLLEAISKGYFVLSDLDMF